MEWNGWRREEGVSSVGFVVVSLVAMLVMVGPQMEGSVLSGV
jgi:hypothetical protein